LKSFLIKEILTPVATRLGAVAAGYLVGKLAVDPDAAGQIGVGLSALCFVLVDLVSRKVLERP